MTLVQWILRAAPLGVAGLVANAASHMGWAALQPLLWFMAAVILGLAVAARGLKEIPGKVQNALEFAIEGLSGFAMGIGGPGAKPFITFFLACFLFIAVSNWSGLIPGVGRIHALRA